MRIVHLYIKPIIAFLYFCGTCIVASFAQNMQTYIDKKDILIGEQFQCNLKLTYPANKFHFFGWETSDSLQHFEIIKKSDTDSSTKNNQTVIAQTITYTSFDSGKWTLPLLIARLGIANSDSAIGLYSDSLTINVSYAVPDSTNQLRDIKPIMQVSDTDNFWYYLVAGAILLLLLVWVLWRYFTRKKPETPMPVTTLSPYEEAMQALNKLDPTNVHSAKELKQYHVQLAAIFKKYISYKTGKSTLHYTTDDVLLEMQYAHIPKVNMANLAAALRCGDAVKFARFSATVPENENCKVLIKEFIDAFEQALIK